MIDFIKYKWLYFLLSASIIIYGIFSILNYGYRFSIEFVGGSRISLQSSLNDEQIRSELSKENIAIKDFTRNKDQINITTASTDEKLLKQVIQNLQKKDKNTKLLGLEIIEPSFSLDLRKKMIIASILAVIVILIYIAFAFKGFLFALSAVIAALHDSLILFGTYSLLSHYFGFEFDSLFITAVLTTLSFSVHDTIVVFDKIREYHTLNTAENIEKAANKALTETMVRSLNNSFTIIFVLTALILFGGETIKHFVYALLIGTITGTYSSPFIATPVFVILRKLKK